MAKLIKSVVDKLPAPEGKRDHVFDDDLKGFGLRVTPGGVKTYFAQAWVRGKKVRVTIGHHGVFTAEQARYEAKRLLLLMAQGTNPADEKARDRAKSVTLGELYEVYQKARNLRPKTIYVYDGALKRCFPDWLDKPITEITKDMVQERHLKLSNANGPRGKGEAQANQAMRVLRSLLNYAASVYEDSDGRPILIENPVRRLSQARIWNRNRRRDSFIAPHELKAWFRAVGRLESDTIRDFLVVCLLTGLRRNEATGLRWEHLDLQGETLRLPGDATKNHEPLVLPLSDHLLALFKRRHGEYRLKTPWVFPGADEKNKLSDPKRAVANVCENSGVKFMIHDLRRTFLTVGANLDISQEKLKKLVNHKDGNNVTAGYIKLTVEDLRAPMQKITTHILDQAGIKPAKKTAVRKGGKNRGKVVSINEGKA